MEELGLAGVVTISPWLPKEVFREQFASSSLVVFPSDFEGFGLPTVEAMRLGIPVVITPEPALLEVTGGHATVVDGEGPEALARAVEVARHASPEAIAAARRHAAAFTWANFASGVRGLLGEATAPAPAPAPVPARRPGRLRTLPARLGAAFAAAVLVVGGATAVSFALGSSHPSHPAAGTGSSATTTGGATSPVVARHGVDQRGGSAVTGSRAAGGGRASATTVPGGGTSGGSQGSSSATPSSTSLPPVTVPPVTVPPVTVPPVTVPPVTVPPVTVPTSVCSTTTTITTPVTTPCSVTVSP